MVTLNEGRAVSPVMASENPFTQCRFQSQGAHGEKSNAGRWQAATDVFQEHRETFRDGLVTLVTEKNWRHFTTTQYAAILPGDWTSKELRDVMWVLEAEGWISVWSAADPIRWRIEF